MTSTKGRTFPAEPLTRDEAMKLIAACGRYPTGVRNRALLWTLYRTGMRISEVLELRAKDLNEPAIRVLYGKGKKTRTVAMLPDAWGAMGLWLARREALSVPRGSPVFCTLKGHRIGHGYIRQMLARYAARAGIEKRVHAHGFRHTLASELVEEGVPLPIVQKALGHVDMSTTARYLQRIGATPHVVAAMAIRPVG